LEVKTIKREGGALFKCVIGLFGLPHEITGEHKVEVELSDEASLTDVIAALRREIPDLEGPVIGAGEDKLTEYYAFNINGRFYIDDKEIRIRSGDHVALLALATGG
jgi:molybdopterin converting factor small subunit